MDPDSPWELLGVTAPGEMLGDAEDFVFLFELNHGRENVADFVLRPNGVVVTIHKNDSKFEIPLEQLLAYLVRIKNNFDEFQRKRGDDNSVAR